MCGPGPFLRQRSLPRLGRAGDLKSELRNLVNTWIAPDLDGEVRALIELEAVLCLGLKRPLDVAGGHHGA